MTERKLTTESVYVAEELACVLKLQVMSMCDLRNCYNIGILLLLCAVGGLNRG